MVNLTFILYFVILLVIGAVAYRHTSNLADYVLGGRKLGKWVTALSAQASDMSGWLLLGLPGLAYAAGLESAWMVIALALGTYLNWRFVAQKLREQSEKYGDALTLPAYFESRFSDTTHLLRLATACFILIFFTFYVSSGLVAAGRLFETVFDFSYLGAISIGLGVILLYTFFGGFFAVSWTDAFQGILMFFALLISALLGVAAFGGLGETAVAIGEINTELLNPFSDAEGSPLGLISILSLLGWGLGYFGQPHILARFMAIRDPKQIGFSRKLAMVWVVVCLIAAMIVGMIGVAYLETPLQGAEDRERVFIVLVEALFHPAVAGSCIAAILAAIMSTIDSQLLVASSTVSEDFCRKFFPAIKEHALLWIGRSAVVLVALVAFWFALDPEHLVLDMVGYAWAGFGASFGPAVLFSLFWKPMNAIGSVCGIVVGGVSVIVWAQLEGGIFELYELAPGFILSSTAIILGSLLWRKD